MRTPAFDNPTQSVRLRIRRVASRLLEVYGPQGWWPVRSERRLFRDPRGERERRGYHPGQFEFPKTRRGRWEIVCGAVLTQNTAWTNVERAMTSLSLARVTTARAVHRCEPEALGAAIRPAGYYNQKSKYLAAVAEWFLKADVALVRAAPSRPLLEQVRPVLLEVIGIGPETADSILLYAYGLPTFVVDAYTRRVFGRLGILEPTWGYERIRHCFETALVQPNLESTVRAWQETHAAIVEHAKRFHGPKAGPKDDFLIDLR